MTNIELRTSESNISRNQYEMSREKKRYEIAKELYVGLMSAIYTVNKGYMSDEAFESFSARESLRAVKGADVFLERLYEQK